MIRYRIDPEERLVIAEFTDKIRYPELLSWHLELAEHPDYAPDFRGIGDMRRAVMEVTREELQALDRINAEHSIVTGAWALLVDSPNETALAMVYNNVQKERHPMRYFSTVEAASDYLNIDLSPFID